MDCASRTVSRSPILAWHTVPEEHPHHDVDHTGTYAAGVANGCLGVWFAGCWRTADAIIEIAAVQRYLGERVWESVNYENG